MTHFITLAQAIAMTSRYRQQHNMVLVPLFQNKNVLPLSETFDKAAIEKLLAQPGCTSLRIYYGMDEELNMHAILVGVNASNTDILPDITSTGEDGTIVDESIRCPPLCPTPGPLNQP